MANEEQGAEEAWQEGDEQNKAESLIVGLNNGSVSVLHKDPQNYSCDNKQAQSCEGDSCPQSILKSQECHRLENAVSSLTIWILLSWALDTLLCI